MSKCDYQGCNRFDGYQPCEYRPTPRKPLPPPRFYGNEPNAAQYALVIALVVFVFISFLLFGA